MNYKKYISGYVAVLFFAFVMDIALPERFHYLFTLGVIIVIFALHTKPVLALPIITLCKVPAVTFLLQLIGVGFVCMPLIVLLVHVLYWAAPAFWEQVHKNKSNMMLCLPDIYAMVKGDSSD